MIDEQTVTLVVNGRSVTRTAGAHLSLLRWLRDIAHITDPKYGCGEGVCGACEVLVDGVPTATCLTLAVQVDGAAITTASALSEADGSMSRLQRSFHEHHAAQCGFCTPGMLVCAADMLDRARQRLSRAEIRDGLDGHLCRCTGYKPIVDAIETAQEFGEEA